MTLAGLNDYISQAQNPEWFNKVQTQLNFPSVNFSHTYVGVPALYKFINDQEAGWSAFDANTRRKFSKSIDFFDILKRTIIQNINALVESTDPNRDSMWQNNILHKNYNGQELIFLFNCPEVEFLMKVASDYPAAFDGAYNFIIGTVNSLSGKVNLIGTLLAYEFTLKNHSQLTERRNAEKKSISSLRTNFGKYVSDNEAFMSNFRKDMADRLSDQDKEFCDLKEGKCKEFDDGLEIKKSIFDTWYNVSTDEYSKFYKESCERKLELENTYSTKLKLEEPAIYWSTRAAKLKNEGWWAMGILIALILLSGIFLGVILWNSPDAILTSWFSNDKSAAIRWSLVFITLLSLIAYGIRAVSKVMFSSFHLARDCEERYTLTYFYLALMKDSNVDPKDSNLIMQSLFSRSDTGLLKEDSSPTMPGAGGIIGNFAGKPN
jgi:hypothetical protein